MARNTSGGPWYGLGLGTAHHNKVAALGNGNYLTEISCEGLVILPYSNPSVAAGNWPTYNLVAGLQYGAPGYTPTDVTNGTPGSNTWITWSNGLPPVHEITDWAGTSPVLTMERATYGLNIKWRGLWYFPSGADIYLVIGMDTSQPVHTSFAPFYFHWAVWAS